MIIRPATNEDHPFIWSIIEPVIRAGETYALDPKMDRGDALDYWFGNDKSTFVAEENGVVLGTYYLRSNQQGGGSHVCNCGYMTSSLSTGRGVARAMCQHSLAFAKSQGYLGMQFNFVVSTNYRAVKLWQSYGFETIGKVPEGFKHPTEGFVDALIMFKSLKHI